MHKIFELIKNQNKFTKSDFFEKNFKELQPKEIEERIKEDKRISVETMKIFYKPNLFAN